MGPHSKNIEFFCGLTMVQRDPKGKIVFLHRNMDKLTRDRMLGEPYGVPVWTHLQYFRQKEFPLSLYKPWWWAGDRVDKQDCFGKAIGYGQHYSVDRVEGVIEELEAKLYAYVYQAVMFGNDEYLREIKEQES